AAGGAWNASIVAEFVTFKGETLRTQGLGAQISAAAAGANFPLLAGSIVVMSTLVVAFNRTVWRQCYRLAEERFSLSKLRYTVTLSGRPAWPHVPAKSAPRRAGSAAYYVKSFRRIRSDHLYLASPPRFARFPAAIRK